MPSLEQSGLPLRRKKRGANLWRLGGVLEV
jgi:hypothetical protein